MSSFSLSLLLSFMSDSFTLLTFAWFTPGKKTCECGAHREKEREKEKKKEGQKGEEESNFLDEEFSLAPLRRLATAHTGAWTL